MNIKYLIISIFVVTTYIFSPLGFASNAVTPNNSCVQYINSITKTIKNVGAIVPFVSPEDKSFLKKEYKASYKPNSKQRFYKLSLHPYYWAWQLHSIFNATQSELLKINNLPKNASIKEKLKSAAFLPTFFSRAIISWDDYVKHKASGLTDAQLQYGYSHMDSINIDFAAYIYCLADKLKDVKT